MGKYGLVAALTMAILLRVGAAVYVGFDAPPDASAGGADVVEFEHMAWTFSEGRGMRNPSDVPTAFRAPGYPLLLGSLYACFGHHYFLNRLLLIGLSVGACGLVFPLARALKLSRPVSALAACICAGLPLQFYYPSHFFSEPPATFFNTLSLLFLVWGLDFCNCQRMRWRWIALAGLMNSASIVVRPISILLIPAIPLLLLVSGPRNWRKALTVGTIYSVTSALLVLPCTIRNFELFEGIALVSTNGGSTLWGSNNAIVANPSEPKWGSWISTNFDAETKQREILVLDNEMARDKAEFALGVKFWRDHPYQVPLLMIGKFVRFFDPFPISKNRPFRMIVGIAAIVLTPLSLLGLYLVCRDRYARQHFLPLLASLLTLLLTTAIFYGSERFRSPLEPQQSIFAAVGLTWFAQKIYSRIQCPATGTLSRSPESSTRAITPLPASVN